MPNDILPSIAELLTNDASSPWLRGVLQGVLASGTEPFEAARDAQLLADVLMRRARAMRIGDSDCIARPVPTIDLFLPLPETKDVAADFVSSADRFLSPSQWIAPPIQRISKEPI